MSERACARSLAITRVLPNGTTSLTKEEKREEITRTRYIIGYGDMPRDLTFILLKNLGHNLGRVRVWMLLSSVEFCVAVEESQMKECTKRRTACIADTTHEFEIYENRTNRKKRERGEKKKSEKRAMTSDESKQHRKSVSAQAFRSVVSVLFR